MNRETRERLLKFGEISNNIKEPYINFRTEDKIIIKDSIQKNETRLNMLFDEIVSFSEMYKRKQLEKNEFWDSVSSILSEMSDILNK